MAEGTISSVPLGFAPDWDKTRHRLALDALCQCLVEFEKIHLQTGRQIRLCLEMEPGCVFESTNDLIPFFSSELPDFFTTRGLDPDLINQYLGICFDVCHQAVMFEDTYEALTRIHNAGINIGKIQISSALELKTPNDKNVRDSLAGFVEQKYLHQSRCMDENNRQITAVKALLEKTPGISRVLDEQGKKELAINHPRSGELVAIAEPGHWFTYYYWLDDNRAPDFAPTVDIHRKPGYDPAELFIDLAIQFPKLRIAGRLLQKKLGFRTLVDVIALNGEQVKGTHGRIFDKPEHGPVLISSEPVEAAESYHMTDIKQLILKMLQ